jgi:hypothetical protein
MSTYKSPKAITGLTGYGTHGKGSASHSTLKTIFPNSPIYGDTYDATKDGGGNAVTLSDSFPTVDEAMLALVGMDKEGKSKKPKIQSPDVLPGVFKAVPGLNFEGPTGALSKNIELGNKIPNITAPNTVGVPSNPTSTQDLIDAKGPSTYGALGKAQPGTGDYSSVKPSTTIKTLGDYMKKAIMGADPADDVFKWDAVDESPNQYAALTAVVKDSPKDGGDNGG